jgi:hypothetical protein
MRRIHQLFVEADQQLIRRATIESGRKALCWYPSAGMDFRHVRMLENEGLNDPAAGPPLIYLHTDVMLPRNWDDSSNPRLLAPNDQVGPRMRIASVTEIHPKRVTREVSKEVCSWSADENTGRAFFAVVEMDTVYRGRLIRVPIPILYFIVENLSFLVHVFLRYQIRLDTLIHIKDGGGSMGGSHIPMNFIYQVAPVLKLKRVVCDESPEAKTFNTRTDFSVLTHEFMRCERHDDRNLSRVFHEHIREVSECDVRSAWEGKRIERGRMSPNEFRPPDGSYCDWYPRNNPKSESGRRRFRTSFPHTTGHMGP